MHVGAGSLCLRVKDLDRAIRFYEALGLGPVEGAGEPGLSALVCRGSFSLFLMTFGEDSLNFRGADAFEVHGHLRAKGLALEGEPERYVREEQGEAGTSWMTRDPDGHAIFFNTHEWETTREHRDERVRQVLRNAEQDLVDLDAGAECLDALRALLARFAPEAAP